MVIESTVLASFVQICREIAALSSGLAALTSKLETVLKLWVGSEVLCQPQVGGIDLKAFRANLEISVAQLNRLQRVIGLNNVSSTKTRQKNGYLSNFVTNTEQASGTYRRKVTEKHRRGSDRLSSNQDTNIYNGDGNLHINIDSHEEPPQRPSSGPAARVQIPDPDQIPLVPVPGWEPLPPALNPRINPGEAPNPGINPAETPYPRINPAEACVNSSHQSPLQEADTEPIRIDVCTELRLNYADLRAATNNFDEGFVIGRGAWGSVYRGELNSPNHQEAVEVAIKRLHSEGTPGDPFLQFQTEIEQLSQLSHENLLPLVGYSIHGPELCLVYSYMENGSLMDRLASQEALHWKTRVNIALGSAEGILFLHTVLPKPLVHRDVKTANILLDGEMIPKLGDFGLVRLGSSGEKDTSVKTKLAVGTSAYMAPEAFQGDISVKMDVFSFGVVMLELLTGLPPFDEDREERDIASHFLDQEERPILEHLDQTAGTWEPSIAEELSKLALGCLESKKKRPNMTNVSQILRDISERIPL